MKIDIKPNEPWYHGTNLILKELRTGSTIKGENWQKGSHINHHDCLMMMMVRYIIMVLKKDICILLMNL